MAEEGAPGMKRLEARIRDLENEIAAEKPGPRSPEMSDPTLRGYKAKVETGLDDAGNPVYTEITGTMEQLRRQMEEIEGSRRAKEEPPASPPEAEKSAPPMRDTEATVKESPEGPPVAEDGAGKAPSPFQMTRDEFVKKHSNWDQDAVMASKTFGAKTRKGEGVDSYARKHVTMDNQRYLYTWGPDDSGGKPLWQDIGDGLTLAVPPHGPGRQRFYILKNAKLTPAKKAWDDSHQGDIVGTLEISGGKGKPPSIDHFVLAPELRGKGYGDILLRAADEAGVDVADAFFNSKKRSEGASKAIYKFYTERSSQPKKGAPPIQETIELESGTYTGETIDGTPNGRGTWKGKDGSVESGIWEDFALKRGTLTEPDGSKFSGEFHLRDGENILKEGTIEFPSYGDLAVRDGVVYDVDGKPVPPEYQSKIASPEGATPAGKKPPASPPKNPWDKIAEQSRELDDKRKEDVRLKDEALKKKLNMSSDRAQRYRREISKISADIQTLAQQKIFFNGLKKSEKFFRDIKDGKVPESLPLAFGDKDVATAIGTLESFAKPSKAQKSLLKRLKNAEYQGEPKRTSKKRKELERSGLSPEEVTLRLGSVRDGWGGLGPLYLQKTKPHAKAEFDSLMSDKGGGPTPIARYLEDTGQRLMVPRGVNDSLAFMRIVREARRQTDAISQMKAFMKRGLVPRRLRGIVNAAAGNWLTEALTDGNLAAPALALKDAAVFHQWRKDPASVPKMQADFFEYADASGLTRGDFISGEIGKTLSEMGKEATGVEWWDALKSTKVVKALDFANAQQEKVWKFVDHSYKIRRAWNSYRKSHGDFLEMSPGSPATVTVSKIKKHKIEKLPDGTWSVDGRNVGSGKDGAMPKRVERILADAGAYDANSKYFDYRFKSRYQAFLTTNPVLAFASPFYSWLFYAMSAPGKRGLAGAMRQTESMIKHTDPKIAFRQNVREFKAATRLFAATQEARQDTEKLSAEASKAIGYGNQAPAILTKGDDDNWFVKSLKNMNPYQPLMDQGATGAAAILELGTATGVLDDVDDFALENFDSREEANAELKKLIGRAKVMTTTPTLENFLDFAGLGGGFGVNNFRKAVWGDPKFSDYMGMVLPAILGGTAADVIDAVIGIADSGSPFSKRSKNPASAESQAAEDFAAETVLSMGAKAIGKAGESALKKYVNRFDRAWKDRYTDHLTSDLNNAEALKDGKRAAKVRAQIKRSNRLRKLAKESLIRELEGRN